MEGVVRKEKQKTEKTEPIKAQDVNQAKLRPIGLDVGKGWVGDNFNDPMPDDFMKAFE